MSRDALILFLTLSFVCFAMPHDSLMTPLTIIACSFFVGLIVLDSKNAVLKFIVDSKPLDPVSTFNHGSCNYEVNALLAQQIIRSWLPIDESEILTSAPVPFSLYVQDSYDAIVDVYSIELQIIEDVDAHPKTGFSFFGSHSEHISPKLTVQITQQTPHESHVRFIVSGHASLLKNHSSRDFEIINYLIQRVEQEFADRGIHKPIQTRGMSSGFIGSKSHSSTSHPSTWKTSRRSASQRNRGREKWGREYVEGSHAGSEVSFWPSPQDYLEAVQNPAQNFKDDDLRQSATELTQLGMPKVATGMFASVYQLNQDEDSQFAVRCFNFKLSDQQERYRAISKFIVKDDLSYTVDFNYIEDGLRVNGSWFPILKMRWVNGDTLDAYLSKQLHSKDKLSELRLKFQHMMAQLKVNGIAHGDLQHGNILISDDEIYLVDYDAFYVPELNGRASNELGHSNYQHPGRTPYHYGPYMDNFSAWVIDLTLEILIADSSLWQSFAGGDECLIFRKSDFVKPDSSKLLQLLLNHPRENVREAARKLVGLTTLAVEDVPYLGSSESLEQVDETSDAVPGENPGESISLKAESWQA